MRTFLSRSNVYFNLHFCIKHFFDILIAEIKKTEYNAEKTEHMAFNNEDIEMNP